MQFIGGKGITLFVAIVLIACGVGFGSGLFVGRQYPVHSFQRFGNTSYLLDSATGKVCILAVFDNPKDVADPDKPFSLEESLNKRLEELANNKRREELAKNPGYPPPCEK
jgi:hypothetical protein